MSDDQVLDAVGKAVLAHGPAALTLAHVAALTGLAPATLLQRFGSKQAMLRAFSKRESSRLPQVHGVVALLVALAGELRTRNDVANSVAFLVEDLKDPHLRKSAAQQASRIEGAIAEALRREGRDPSLAHTLWCAQNGAVIQWAIRGDGALADAIERAVAPILAARARA